MPIGLWASRSAPLEEHFRLRSTRFDPTSRSRRSPAGFEFIAEMTLPSSKLLELAKTHSGICTFAGAGV